VTVAVIELADLQAINPDIDTAKAEAMIQDAVAQATLVAPCLADEAGLTNLQVAQFKAVLRAAIVRWDDAGSGAVLTEQVTAGPFAQSQTVDSSRLRKGLFWPSELDLLQKICGTGRKAGTVDVTPDIPARRSILPDMSIDACTELGGPLPDDPLQGARL